MSTIETPEINGETYLLGDVDANPNVHAQFFEIKNKVLFLKPEYRGAAYGAILFVPGMDVTKGYYYVNKFGKEEQDLYLCVQTSNSNALEEHGGYPQDLGNTNYFKAVARDENRISDNGAGMAGSKNYALPELLYIPNAIGDDVVEAIAPVAFDHNQAIRKVVLPSAVKIIPEQCFFGCQRLESVHNTEHITNVGKLSFSRCVALKEIYLPGLLDAETKETEIDAQVQAMSKAQEKAFRDCISLEYAHIGKITVIPDEFFRGCYKLKSIDHEGSVTCDEACDEACKYIHVGKGAFLETYALEKADFIENVKSMDIGAFFKSGINYDWGKFPENAFKSDNGIYKAYPTSFQLNPTDFWSKCKKVACSNPTPTHFCQMDPRWINRYIGNTKDSGSKYGNGCAIFTLLHAYCGLNNLPLSHVAEFEGIVNGLVDNDPSIWTDIQKVRSATGIKEWAERLGLSVTEYYEYNRSTLQKLYDALFYGNYAYAVVPTYTTRRGVLEVNSGGHAALISGVTEDGRLIVTDSKELYPEDMTVGNKYAALYQSSFHPGVESNNMIMGASNDDWQVSSLGGSLYSVKNVGRGNFMIWRNEEGNWGTSDVSDAATNDQCRLSFYVIGKGILSEDSDPSVLQEGDQVIIFAPAYGKALSAGRVIDGSCYYNKGVNITLTDSGLSGYGDDEIWTVTKNSDGTYSFKNDDKKIGLNAVTPQFCIITKPVEYSIYATIEDALAGSNLVTNGKIGAYTDKYGKYHIVLLGDIESAVSINIQRDCTLHLNGYTLNFTASGAHLNINTANEVVIDGTVAREQTQTDGTVKLHYGTIKKDGIASNAGEDGAAVNELLIHTKGTNLTIYGGEYSITNVVASGKSVRAISAGTSNPVAKVKLHDCSITASAAGATKSVYGVIVDALLLNHCTVNATSEDSTTVDVCIYADSVIKNCELTSHATGTGSARGINMNENGITCDLIKTIITATANGYNTSNDNEVIGVYVNSDSTLKVTECEITAKRSGVNESDYTDSPDTDAINGLGTVNADENSTFKPPYQREEA